MEKTNDPIPPPAAPPEAPLRGPGYDMSILQQDDRPLGATSTTAVTTKGWEAGSNHEHRQEKLRMKDIARLLQEDYNDFNQDAEVTVEQLQRVRRMHDRFMDGAVFSFNYNTLLLVACVIAGLGLVSNSSATIIASMLVSPIMGPVVALAYGTIICDWKMVRLAAITEAVSLFICVVIGVALGAITGNTALVEDWPTEEMTSRATLQSLLVGIPIAFFSGLGVAVSLLDEQVNSLVGVAISASLLPPAVNCGLLWVAYFFASNEEDHSVKDNQNYSKKDVLDAGLLSLGLTLANIALIWLSSIIMFRLKELLPIEKKIFWSDLGIARKIYRGKALMRQSPETLRTRVSVYDARKPDAMTSPEVANPEVVSGGEYTS